PQYFQFDPHSIQAKINISKCILLMLSLHFSNFILSPLVLSLNPSKCILLMESNTLGFECSLEEVDLHDITENQLNTLRACTAADPGPGNCPVLEKSTFDEGKCLQGISEDVRAYRAQLRSLPDPQLLAALDGMMEVRIPAPHRPQNSPGLGQFQGSNVGYHEEISQFTQK
uniref:IL-12A n=1 Tax=Zonotrichia albicollis TaxID=44394 RepID=A0A8D2MAF8_ZONAL